MPSSPHLNQLHMFNMIHRIQMLATQKEPNVNEGLKILEEARDQNLLSAGIFSAMLYLIASAQNVELCLAFQLFDEAKRLGLDTPPLYSDILYAIAKSKKPNSNEGYKIFKEARRKNALSSRLYTCMIYIIQKTQHPNFVQAYRVFDQAKRDGKLSAQIFTNMIYTIARKKAHPRDISLEAYNLFREAIDLRFFDQGTYESVLYAFSKNTEPDVELSMEILNEAKDYSLETARSYMHVLTILAFGDYKKTSYDGVELLDEISAQYPEIPDMRNGEFFNLDGLSFGVVYFGLKRRLEEELKEKRSSPLTLTLSFDEQSTHGSAIMNARVQSLRKAITCVIKRKGISESEIQMKLEETPITMSILPTTTNITKHSIFSPSRSKELSSDEYFESFHPIQN